jgi:tetratricopeptide (TPR) repeat protein
LDKAQEYFEEALTLFAKINAQSGNPAKENISIYNNLGVIAKERQESEKALNYYKSGIDLARKTPGFETELGNLLNNLGNIYLLLGKPELSFQHLNETLELRAQKNDMTGLVKSYLALGEYYKFKNLDDEGLGMLYSALELSDKVGILSSKAEAQKHLFELYQKKGDYDSAFKHHVQYTELENQINKESAFKEIKQLEIAAKYKESQKQAEVELKQKESNYLFIGMIMILTIFILSSLYRMNYNKTSLLTLEKENMSLNTKNIELENEKLEKELEFKNKQLTTGVIYQVKNNEIINNIILKLQNLNGKNPKTKMAG